MPDHFHALLTPSEETTLEKAVQMIKGGSAHRINRELNCKWPVWQSGFHDRWIRDEQEYDAKVDYIRSNPVAAKLANKPDEYVLSSACGKYQLNLPKFEDRTSGAEAPIR